MNETTIQTFAKWQVKPEQLNVVIKLIGQIVAASTKEEGNLFYQVYQKSDDPNMLLLFEGYKDEVALQKHRDSTHFKNIVVNQIVPMLESREVILGHPLLFDA